MSLNESENFNPANQEIEKNKQERSIEQMEKALGDLCERYGNKITIHLSGSKRLTVIPQLREFTQKLPTDYRNTLEFIKEGVIDFLHAPIFTDGFGKDHSARRIWEGIDADKKEVENALFAEGLYDYYNSNRLNTHCWSVIEMLKDISHTTDAHYPPKLVAQLDEVFNQYENDIPAREVYDKYSDDEKLASMDRIEIVMKKILNVICVESDN